MVRTGFDQITLAVTGFDFETRCSQIGQHVDSEGSFSYTEFVGSRNCYNFQASREFKGIYIDEFEGQRFIEGAVSSERYSPIDNVWLEFDEKSDLGSVGAMKGQMRGTRIWQIEFEGQKAVQTLGGSFGHLGGSDGLILVNRLKSARLLHEQEGYLSEAVIVR